MTPRTNGPDWPVWFRIGLLGFGGPAGQIALMHREIVKRKGWVDETTFQHALSFCMLLPGPEAQQLATYLGWLRRGVAGGLLAGLLFVAPGLALMLALSSLYVTLGAVPAVSGFLDGVKAAVLALVLQAGLRLVGRNIRSVFSAVLALVALAAVSRWSAAFPLVILGAALLGWLTKPAKTAPVAASTAPRPRAARQALTALLWFCVWIGPLVALSAGLGWLSTPAKAAGLFSLGAVFSFGGAYALLGFIAKLVVRELGWLSAAQMVDGLGLAETTPGPLILVLVFVAFVAAFQAAPEGLAWAHAFLAGLMAAWAVFAPSFLWIFVGAPYVERIRRNGRLAGALSAVAAAVVGVIASLALWFALKVLFSSTLPPVLGVSLPDPNSFKPPAALCAALGLFAVFFLRLGPLTVVLLCGTLGLSMRFAHLM